MINKIITEICFDEYISLETIKEWYNNGLISEQTYKKMLLEIENGKN